MATVPDPRTSELAAARYALAGQYSPTPDTVRADDFERWPASVQGAFVRAFAEGASPASILVGKEGASQAIATLSAGGGDVTITRAPTDINKAPGELPIATFMNWPNEAQVFYARANGSGQPTAVTIGSAGATVTATVTRDAFGNAAGVTLTSSAGVTAAGAATLAKLPANLSAAEYFNLLPDQQAAYVRANGRIDPNDPTRTPKLAIAGAGADGTPITLTGKGGGFTVIVPAGTYPGFGIPLTGQTSAVPEATFSGWPREVQRAYVEAQTEAYPKSLVLAGGSFIAFIAAEGADVDTLRGPSEFNGLPDASTFLDWPLGAQIAYARRNAENPAAAQPLVLAGRNGQSLAVSLAPEPAGITLAAPAMPGLAVGDVNLDLFQLWPTAAQVDYLATKGSRTPQSLVLGSDTALLTLGAGGLPKIEPFPPAFGTDPATLAPATFLTWSPAFQALLLDRKGTLANGVRSLTVGDPAGPTLTLSATGSATNLGAVQVTSDALRIGSSVAMTLKLSNPTGNIYGSDVGLSTEPNAGNAQSLFPILTGQTGMTAAGQPYTIVDKPADVAAQFLKAATVLTPAEFGKWNTAIQLEYLRLNGDAAKGFSSRIGPSGDQITAFVSSTGTKVYTAETLQKTDIGKMTLADQMVLAGLDAFTRPFGVAESKGLTGNKAAALALPNALRDAIITPGGLKGGDSNMSFADKKVFLDQVALLRAKIDNSGIFALKEIQDQVDEIKARFERANSFATALPKTMSDLTDLRSITLSATDFLFSNKPNGLVSNSDNIGGIVDQFAINANAAYDDLGTLFVDSGSGRIPLTEFIGPADKGQAGTTYTKVFDPAREITIYSGRNAGISVSLTIASITMPIAQTSAPVVSLDDNQGLILAYNVFMAQERQLLSLATSRQGLATGTGPSSTQNLDVPNLVYLFQLYSNLAGEAKIRSDTEEINQTNAFVKVYAVMQNLVNNTYKSVATKSTDETELIGSNADKSQTDEEKVVVKMFKAGLPLAPIEILRGITRPTDALAKQAGSKWQSFSGQLADRVALINQESQIKMNDVNSQTKAKDRNFELANNALSKMNEIVQKIAST